VAGAALRWPLGGFLVRLTAGVPAFGVLVLRAEKTFSYITIGGRAIQKPSSINNDASS